VRIVEALANSILISVPIPCIDRVRRVVARARDQEHELPRVKMK
jgi:hypothetical protein